MRLGEGASAKTLRHLLLAAMLAVTMTVAACGSDDDGGSTGGSTGTSTAATVAEEPAAPAEAGDVPTPGDVSGREERAGYVYAGTDEQVEEARAAGEQDAGDPVDPPTGKKIGMILLSEQSATSRSASDAAKRIADLFGFSVEVCDPNFDAQKVQQCATSIAAKKPDAVISVSQNPGPMGSGVKQVADQGGLWFGVGSGGEPSEYVNDYGIDGIRLAEVLDQFMFATIKEKNPDGDGKIFAITAPTVGVASKNSGDQLKRDVESAEGFELIDHNLDLANAVQDTLNTTRQTLEQNPSLSAMWTLCDFCVPLMAQTTEQKQPDRKTVVVGQFSSPESIADVRAGKVDGIADYPWASQVWVAMDQALQKWARDQDPVKGFDVFGSYSLPFMEPYVITPDNALDSGPAPIYGPDFETYFRAKWAKEFGVGS